MATGNKCALVVDDSKSARVVLRKMLEKNDLTVETAASAEDAIDFLSRRAPDVIFMDHMMPGMDGFQAIKHIKENPRTAMIPIVMYTSQDGEVYVGQARALGAVDVLAKDIRPTELNKVLLRLNLVDKSEKPAASANVTHGAASSVSNSNQVRVNLSDAAVQRLARQTSDLIRVPDSPGVDSDKVHTLLEEQRLQLRQDIAAATRNAHSSTSKKFESLDARLQYLTDLVERDEEETPVNWRNHAIWLFIVIAVMIATWYSSASMLAARSVKSSSAVVSPELLTALEQENEILKAELALVEPQRKSTISDANWLDAVQWAINLSGTYPYTDTPLDDGQLLNLQTLIDRLERGGFEGEVRINVHVGNFCLIRNSFDQLELAGNDQKLAACEQISIPAEEAQAISANQSLNFANYIDDLLAQSPDISLRIVAHGNESPRVRYPVLNETESVKSWNRVAAQNNRLEYQLIGKTTR